VDPLPEGHSICDLCQQPRSTALEYWEGETAQLEGLREWKFPFRIVGVELDDARYEAKIGDFVRVWCGGQSDGDEEAEEDDDDEGDPLKLLWVAYAVWEQVRGVSNVEEWCWMGKWCPPCWVQVIWEVGMLSFLFGEAGYVREGER
jgi:hypothetical protein